MIFFSFFYNYNKMVQQLKNLVIVNDNILLGKISISPDVPSSQIFNPKVENLNCVITFSDINSDFSKLKSICSNAIVDNGGNYYFYDAFGTCITKLTEKRNNNLFGTIYPKMSNWKFLKDVTFKKIDGFQSYFVFNKYPGVYELTDDDNIKMLIENDILELKKKNVSEDIFCYVSRPIFQLFENFNIKFPFNNFKVVSESQLLSNLIEILMGKVIISGNPFSHGFIRSTILNEYDGLQYENNSLHVEYTEKRIFLQALRGGIVEYSSSVDCESIPFVIFYEHSFSNLYLDDTEIPLHSCKRTEDENMKNITSMLIDYENIKCNGKKFVMNEDNIRKIHNYKFKKNTGDDDLSSKYDEFTDIIKSFESRLLKNIRMKLTDLENKENENICTGFSEISPQFGRQVSDGSILFNNY